MIFEAMKKKKTKEGIEKYSVKHNS